MCKVSNWIWKTLDGGGNSTIFAPAIHTHIQHISSFNRGECVLKKMQSTNTLGEYLNGNVRMLHIFLFYFPRSRAPVSPVCVNFSVAHRFQSNYECLCVCKLLCFLFFSLHDPCVWERIFSHSSHSLSHLTWTFNFEMVSNYHESNIIKSIFHSYAMRCVPPTTK